MRKKLLFGLLTLSCLALVACQGGTSTSSNSSSSITSNPSSVTSSNSSSSNPSSNTSLPSEEGYLLTVETLEGGTVSIIDASENSRYEGGRTISFTVDDIPANKALLNVRLNDVNLTKNSDGTFSFVMPNVDSILKVELLTLGEENLLDNKEVTQEMIPTNVDGVISLLEKEQSIEGKYFSSGNYSYQTSETYEKVFDYHIESYHNKALRITGNEKTSSSNPFTTSFVEERGLTDNNRYYVYRLGDGSFSNNEPSSEYKESMVLYNVVSDDETNINAMQDKTENEVNNQIESYGFASILLEKYFDKDSYSAGFASGYAWKNVSVRSAASADKLSFTTTLTANYDNYINMEYHVLNLTFDGNGFLLNAKYTCDEYAYSDFDNSSNKPNEDATSVGYALLSMEANKGYKQYYQDKIDVNDYAMHDYDVAISYKHDSFDKVTSLDNVVEVGSVLSFDYTSHDHTPYLVKPMALETKEEGFVEQTAQGLKVLKDGDFTLIFDNGAGELKEVNLKAVVPEAKKITAKLADQSIFVGGKTVLSAEILPSGANQNYDISVDTSSTGSITFEKLENNTYEITGVSAGDVTINVASSDKKVSTTVSLSVKNKPNIDAVKTMLFEKTMSYSDGGERFYINFNEDGTGEYRYGSEDYWSEMLTYEDLVTFNYVINEETLAIDITLDSSVPYGNLTLVGVAILDDTSIAATTRFFDTNEDPWTMTGLTRIDLSSL